MAWQIIWSEVAEKDLNTILEFWIQHNKSSAYSIKLATIFHKATQLLMNMPYSGISTDMPSIRCLYRENYSIFYELAEPYIVIHRIWDNRQNPKDIYLY